MVSLLPKLYEAFECALERFKDPENKTVTLKDLIRLHSELMDRAYGKPKNVLDVLYEQKITTGTINLNELSETQLKQMLQFQAGSPEARAAMVRAMSGESPR
jgi:hypothetical protein